MSDTEWVYSLFIEANPIPDPERFLASRHETDLLVIEGSQDMDIQQLTKVPATEPGSLRRVAAIAFAAVVVVAGVVAGVALLAGDESGVASGGGDTPIGGQSEATINNVHEVTFDGDTCTYLGPSEIPAGNHSLLLTDESGGFAIPTLIVRFLSDGHTYQDIVDDRNKYSPATWPRPYFALDVPLNWDSLPDVDVADNQQLISHAFRPGSYSVGITSNTWTKLCGPLDVVEP